ncbi:ATP-binding protein [Streptomyces indicus]|uniref:Histidine kinase-like ATPase domain-containing protein n=1 Tax=Streptomyces indicus TaxID=417292 RepID=A0A1G9FL29_9ACTN|nr:Histidine kinase-like ATPase domain-containing protein [Streptomyces indicus]
MAIGNAAAQPDLGRRCRFELPAGVEAVPRARRMTRERLRGWAVCDETRDLAALVVSELVTNAVVHTASRLIVCELHDDHAADVVRIAVTDEGCGPDGPAPHPARDAGEDHGRGLLLVQAMCRSWGAQEAGLGLEVWAHLPRTAVPEVG